MIIRVLIVSIIRVLLIVLVVVVVVIIVIVVVSVTRSNATLAILKAHFNTRNINAHVVLVHTCHLLGTVHVAVQLDLESFTCTLFAAYLSIILQKKASGMGRTEAKIKDTKNSPYCCYNSIPDKSRIPLLRRPFHSLLRYSQHQFLPVSRKHAQTYTHPFDRFRRISSYMCCGLY